jgi:hypothetical protein
MGQPGARRRTLSRLRRLSYEAVSDWTERDEDRAPICPYCGVTMLPADPSTVIDTRFVCENPGCDAFGEIDGMDGA